MQADVWHDVDEVQTEPTNGRTVVPSTLRSTTVRTSFVRDRNTHKLQLNIGTDVLDYADLSVGDRVKVFVNPARGTAILFAHDGGRKISGNGNRPNGGVYQPTTARLKVPYPVNYSKPSHIVGYQTGDRWIALSGL